MKILTAILTKPITWIISSNFPASTPIDSAKAWHLLNPILPLPVCSPEGLGPLPIDRGACLLVSHTISIKQEEDGLNEENVVSYIEQLLRRLRYLSGQADMPDVVAASAIQDLKALPCLPTVADFQDGFRVAPRPVVTATALTLETITKVAELPIETEVPAHAELFLDAVSAYKAHDYKKCILFAAFTLEVGTEHCLGRDFQRALGRSSSIERFRVVEQRSKDGEVDRRDPVYDELSRRARGSFRFYLHELPLYVRGKSLLEERKDLYDLALEVRKSRNALAHSGNTDSRRVPLAIEGAAHALFCAKEVLAWFEDDGNFVLPEELLKRI